MFVDTEEEIAWDNEGLKSGKGKAMGYNYQIKIINNTYQNRC